VKITLVDVGLGNLHSVERALRASGASDVAIVSDPDRVRIADAIVVPGQGAFRDCASALAGGLGEAIVDRIRSGVPYLGICLGMQALFGSSDEAPGARGLGVFEGRVRKLVPSASSDKVPHTGWNTAERTKPCILPEAGWFYFVHSFVAEPSQAGLIAATTTHGSDRFTSAIAKDNVLAVQFHPEKSQSEGIHLLKRWIASA
jgi:glutamine amidotransferase